MISNIKYWFINLFETLERMFYWGWKLRKSYDFDGNTLFDIIHLKLERLYKCHRDHGHCEWNSSTETKLMKRLKEASELAKRLSDEEYTDKYSMRVFSNYIGSEGDGFIYDSHKKFHPEAKEIDSNLYSVMLKKALNKDYKNYTNNKNRLFKLLDRYLDRWWD